MSEIDSTVPHEVLLCNFGGPAEEAEVAPFLRRLFEDPFIIRAPLGPMRRLLAKRIATKRAPASAEEYRHIGFSPINRLTETVARGLEQRLQRKRPQSRVMVVNRYTPPFAEDVVPTLNPKARRFVLTLYPHFCHSTVASSLKDLDLAHRAHFDGADLTATRIFSWWHNPKYLSYTADGVIEKVKEVLPALGQAPLTILYSMHGIPVRYHMRGDPYCHEAKSHTDEVTRRVREVLSASFPAQASQVHFQLCYQSRVGPVEWVKPYTEETIQSLGKERGGMVMLVPLSFTSDHIETLYEMDVTYKEVALANGFSQYARVAPANDDPRFIDCLVSILEGCGY